MPSTTGLLGQLMGASRDMSGCPRHGPDQSSSRASTHVILPNVKLKLKLSEPR